MKVKICGLTNKEDAVWAINYGADYLGINFHKESPRHVSLNSAIKWVSELPSFASTVGVFVNEDPAAIIKAVQKLNLNGIQLHGDESPDYISKLKLDLESKGETPFIIKAFKIKNEQSLENLKDYKEIVDYFLLDSFVPGQDGGTGTIFNWDLAQTVQEDLGKPIFLAGGLNSENVAKAIKKVNPFAVDVASGVEKSPKRKDPNKIKSFLTAAK